ncbi:hypothetical protein M422DRAFT_267241 [Sphaerobolus stellatus SS14]|uniref:cystathionine gamma-lyase n=1 Tax=Sphaerobolus stellatus (strain SS14) TaxID=990650 RepID=A0A0C9V0K9_SPHS4|nr:hypothetical protein M422DRAFT_267241 [Sphaerobolus stellatus SS14]
MASPHALYTLALNIRAKLALLSYQFRRSLIWIEPPTNSSLRLSPIAHITSLIHSLPAASRPLIAIDPTFLSLAAPIFVDLTALHHKYINGHSDVLMGAVILPNASTAETNGILQNAHGDVPGANTDGAIKLAQFLFAHPIVKEVIYPGFAEHPDHNNTAKILASHARKFVDEWVLADEAKIGRVGALADSGAAERFLTWTRLFALAERLGGVESLAECRRRWRTGSSERLALGITPEFVRLSVGVEDVDDLIADVEQALSWTINGWNSATASVASGDSD